MRTILLRRLGMLGLLLAVMAGLVGCFDYEVELALTTPGEGSLGIRLTLPEYLTQGYPVGQLDTIVFPKPERQYLHKGGLLTISETNKFPHLDELAARRVLFDIKEVGTGLVGLTAHTYRVTARMELAEGDLPDRNVQPGTELEEHQPGQAPAGEDARRARELVAQSLAGHYLSMSMKFPGEAAEARPLVLGASVVEPQVSQDGGRVTWRVPLAVLVNENVRQTLIFSCDFKGRFDFRAYMQKEARSHYPDYFDEGLAAGKDMGDRGRPQGYVGKRGSSKTKSADAEPVPLVVPTE